MTNFETYNEKDLLFIKHTISIIFDNTKEERIEYYIFYKPKHSSGLFLLANSVCKKDELSTELMKFGLAEAKSIDYIDMDHSVRKLLDYTNEVNIDSGIISFNCSIVDFKAIDQDLRTLEFKAPFINNLCINYKLNNTTIFTQLLKAQRYETTYYLVPYKEIKHYKEFDENYLQI